MRLRFREYNADPESRRALKPVVGDIVLYQGVKYRVYDAGMKYLRIELVENPRQKGIVKMQDVTKWIPDDQLNEPMQLENLGATD